MFANMSTTQVHLVLKVEFSRLSRCCCCCCGGFELGDKHWNNINPHVALDGWANCGYSAQEA